ncbi:MAG: helix-turn-helix transcriptional regulator [Cyanobacteriota/Melainabacteria group bacterium]|nr:helix-turn-helix transcriptional regulator [Cyanobacteria bacterium HKST-UBA01]MCB9472096.1 helix-turn-helix transcriptional regulator [Candidatus Obscuribacterales bacterium]
MKEKNLIRSKRCSMDYTIPQLSVRTGIPAFILQSIEKGVREPSLEELHSISTVLNIDPMSLVDTILSAREDQLNEERKG